MTFRLAAPTFLFSRHRNPAQQCTYHEVMSSGTMQQTIETNRIVAQADLSTDFHVVIFGLQFGGLFSGFLVLIVLS